MALLTLFLKATAIYFSTWVLWRLFRHRIVRSPFDNIPGPPSGSFWTGNLAQIWGRHSWSFQRELCDNYGSVINVKGILGKKELFVFDPAALHSMCIDHSEVYEETTFSISSNRLMFGGGLLACRGEEHRKQRKILNPVFNSRHLKSIQPTFYGIAHKLRDAIADRVKDGAKEIDLVHWCSRTALELVGQGGLGHSFDSLADDIDNGYTNTLKALAASMVPTYPFADVIGAVLPRLVQLGSAAFRRSVVESTPVQTLQRARMISDSMAINSRNLIAAKKRAMALGDEAVLRQVGAGKDIMSRLLQANASAETEDKLSDEELQGQMAFLVFAATDTTSGAIVRILEQFAKNPDLQQKAREEIKVAKAENPTLSSEELGELPWFDAVCKETLRVYPPVIQVARTALKDMLLPLSTPITGNDGTPMKEIVVPEGSNLYISILASNTNPVVWDDDAHEWKPERWFKPLPETVSNAHIPGLYSNLLTFLGGGRSCVGFKFAQMEMRIVLSTLLESFTFLPSDKPITWNLAGIQYPTVGRDSIEDRLPFKVALLGGS